jgi:hypothetical protein
MVGSASGKQIDAEATPGGCPVALRFALEAIWTCKQKADQDGGDWHILSSGQVAFSLLTFQGWQQKSRVNAAGIYILVSTIIVIHSYTNTRHFMSETTR